MFGWRDPARAPGTDPYEGWEVDFARLAFRPESSEMAPPGRSASERHWWDAFWNPAPPQQPAGRGEALFLLRKSEALMGSATLRHSREWGALQMSGLVGAVSGWIAPAGPADAVLRLAFVRPPIPDNAQTRAPLPAITQLTFGLQQQFDFERGQTPVGILYAAIRASRRAVAENPSDATTYYLLAQTYAALANKTTEKSWAARLPQLVRLRQLQASAAPIEQPR